MSLTHGSLFSGIGGFDLAAQWMGWENLFHCEINSFCQRLLKYYWPNAKTYTNIKETDFTAHRGTIDVLSGGFPCQPYSTAGKRLGKEDDRHLWPEMLRAIREIRPRWVVGENVRGLVSWNGGMVFEEVQADLEAEGYEVQPFILSAASVGAPHKRCRVWFIAYSDGNVHKGGLDAGRDKRQAEGSKGEYQQQERWYENGQRLRTKPYSGGQNASYSNGRRCTGCKEEKVWKQSTNRNAWDEFPTQPPFCGGDDGLSTELDGITFPRWRRESIQAYGNAVVPQIPFRIFKAIEQYQKINIKP